MNTCARWTGCVALMFATGVSWAAGVPSTIHAQGVLRQTAGGLESGSFDFHFRLYSSAVGGTPLYEETQNAVPVQNGILSTRVGQLTPIPPTLFRDNPALFLGIEMVGDPGGEMAPRLPLGTAPYAFQAAHADEAANADTLDSLDSTAFQRALTAVDPIVLNGNTLSLAVTGCAANQFLQWGGSAWSCADAAAAAVSSLTAGDGLEGGGGPGVVSLALRACADGEILKRIGGAWTCTADDTGTGDITDVTTITGSGLTGGASTGTVALALLTCLPTEVLKVDSSGAWACAADEDTGGDITAVTVAAGSGLQGGGAAGSVSLGLQTCGANEILKSDGTDWFCAADENSGDVTGVAAGTGLTGGGASGEVTLALMSCSTDGQVLKYDATLSTWGCASDIDTDTTYSAGAGIAISGTQVISIPDNGLQATMFPADVVTSDAILDKSLVDADVSDTAAIAVSKINGAAALAGDNSFSGLNRFTGAETTVTGQLTLNTGTGVDAVLTETGITRTDSTTQTFSITNPGTGGMRLDLEASSANNAPLRIPAGATPTTPIDGDTWHDSTVGGLNVRSDGATQHLSGTLCINTTSETDQSSASFTTFGTQCAIPLAALRTGRVLRVTLIGTINNDEVADTFRFNYQLGGTSVVSSAVNTLENTGNRQWVGSALIFVTGVGAGTITVDTNGNLNTNGRNYGDTTVGRLNITSAASMPFTVQHAWDNAEFSDTITLSVMMVELL